MSVIKGINRPAPLEQSTNYVLRKSKAIIAEGINCRPETFYDEVRITQGFYCKDSGREFYHFVKSFPPGEVTPEEAMADAREWISRNPDLHGFEILLVAHCEPGKHCHVHMLINSVCAADGHKLHVGKKRYRDVWLPLNRQVDEDHGRQITERKDRNPEEVRTATKRKWEVIARKGEDSDIGHVYRAVSTAMTMTDNWAEFEQLLKENEVLLERKTGRKHLVFQFNGHRFRDSNLSKTFSDDISAERIEHEFLKRGEEHEFERQIDEIDREVKDLGREVERLLRGEDKGERGAVGEAGREAARPERINTRTR